MENALFIQLFLSLTDDQLAVLIIFGIIALICVLPMILQLIGLLLLYFILPIALFSIALMPLCAGIHYLTNEGVSLLLAIPAIIVGGILSGILAWKFFDWFGIILDRYSEYFPGNDDIDFY
jgi:hypothetical protein